MTKIHYLSGPFEIEDAEPGDVLIVDICDVQPHQSAPWGFTGSFLLPTFCLLDSRCCGGGREGRVAEWMRIGVFAKENGGGFLDEIYPSA